MNRDTAELLMGVAMLAYFLAFAWMMTRRHK